MCLAMLILVIVSFIYTPKIKNLTKSEIFIKIIFYVVTLYEGDEVQEHDYVKGDDAQQDDGMKNLTHKLGVAVQEREDYLHKLPKVYCNYDDALQEEQRPQEVEKQQLQVQGYDNTPEPQEILLNDRSLKESLPLPLLKSLSFSYRQIITHLFELVKCFLLNFYNFFIREDFEFGHYLQQWHQKSFSFHLEKHYLHELYWQSHQHDFVKLDRHLQVNLLYH